MVCIREGREQPGPKPFHDCYEVRIRSPPISNNWRSFVRIWSSCRLLISARSLGSSNLLFVGKTKSHIRCLYNSPADWLYTFVMQNTCGHMDPIKHTLSTVKAVSSQSPRTRLARWAAGCESCLFFFQILISPIPVDRVCRKFFENAFYSSWNFRRCCQFSLGVLDFARIMEHFLHVLRRARLGQDDIFAKYWPMGRYVHGYYPVDAPCLFKCNFLYCFHNTFDIFCAFLLSVVTGATDGIGRAYAEEVSI